MYIIKSSPLTLIDAGPKSQEAYDQLGSSLRQHGVRIESIERIILTHAHPDHYGMAQTLKDLSGATIYLHPKESAKLQGDWDKLTATRSTLLVESGVPDGALKSFLEESDWSSGYTSRIVDLEPVEAGHRFLFEEGALEVLHVPGHASGHICLYERDSGVLFSGDHLLKDVSPNPIIEPSSEEKDGRTRSLRSYLRSLEQLREVDISVAMPAHGDSIHDVQAKIDDLFRHHEQRAERIFHLLSEVGQTAYVLSTKLFPGLSGFEVLLAVSEIIAHIDLLVERGRATCARSNGVYLYYRLAETTSRSAW